VHWKQISWEYPATFVLEAVNTYGAEADMLKSAEPEKLPPQSPAS
jgi:hypothetical protein